ncbi:MAG: hypothetical protein N3E40_04750 [Dehalococcoidia bacterium]|nr:hypothetical protein [Dehalococcoidia bacterium]
MQFWIMKSGLPVLDAVRAYGLAVLLASADESQVSSPRINDAGHMYLLELESGSLKRKRLLQNLEWQSYFSIPDKATSLGPSWSFVFVTTKGAAAKTKNVASVRNVLENDFDDIVSQSQKTGLLPRFSGETLPGGLEPSAFKGSKSVTRTRYEEAQTELDRWNWALACLGGSLALRYIWQDRKIFALCPLPESIEYRSFREIRNVTFGKGLRYHSLQAAAAHYSVVLAEAIRSRRAVHVDFSDRYSDIVYFSLFLTGNQWKPSGAGRVSLHKLLDMAFKDEVSSAKVFAVWDYLFRRGSVRGSEDLAEAITSLVIDPSLGNFERHNRILLSYIGKKEVKMSNLYDSQSLEEVICYV